MKNAHAERYHTGLDREQQKTRATKKLGALKFTILPGEEMNVKGWLDVQCGLPTANADDGRP